MRAKMNRYGTFLTLVDRFKNHIFYERKRMKKLALFLTDVKKEIYNISSVFSTYRQTTIKEIASYYC
jgi:hypothetical protein